LGYCTPKRFIRKGEVFYCTHCEDKWIRLLFVFCFKVKRVKFYIFYAQLGIMSLEWT
jgi:hypothetical protein